MGCMADYCRMPVVSAYSLSLYSIGKVRNIGWEKAKISPIQANNGSQASAFVKNELEVNIYGCISNW
jgi:hypothetical protein